MQDNSPPVLLRSHSHLSLEELDRRVRIALTAAAKESGPKARMLMATALANGPSRNGVAESKAFFGDDLPLVLKLLDPTIIALNQGMPGFSQWLDRTGYSNDVTMIRALYAWIEHQDKIDAGERLRHGLKGLG